LHYVEDVRPTRTPVGTEDQAPQQVRGERSGPESLRKLTEKVTIGGRKTWRSVYDAPARSITSTSPMGRTVAAILDHRGRIVESRVPGVAAVRYAYDGEGRLARVTQTDGVEVRTTSLGYGALGYLESITDSEARTTTLQADSLGQVFQATAPDGREIFLGYDANGNVISVTPPGRPEHTFDYTPVDLEREYGPPVVPGTGPTVTTREYNLDRQLTRVARPDGQARISHHE